MKITAELIKTFNPCKDRFDNFVKEYPNYKGDWYDFLALERISYADKIWVAVRLMSKEQLVRWSILCAESVLHIYEAKYPYNKEVRNLLEYLNKIESFENLSDEQKELIFKKRKSAHAAAYSAHAAAYSAYVDYAAAYAVCSAAYAATYAAAAAASTAAYSAHAAAYSAYVDYAAAYAKEEQRCLNLLYLTSVVDL